jgi:hypothetical protein
VITLSKKKPNRRIVPRSKRIRLGEEFKVGDIIEIRKIETKED